jgi:hypothetical protein
MFKKVLLASVLVSSLVPMALHASCTTYGTYTTCTDGNTYNRLGNSVYGSNARTGSTWSQHQFGNTTIGNDSKGNSWSTTTTPYGSYGYDSNGNSWNTYGR